MKKLASIAGAGLAFLAVKRLVQEFVGPTIYISKSDFEDDMLGH